MLLDSFVNSNPELLQIENKILIDNSVDTSTIPEYDRLARQFGLTVIRRGNMGITGSRYWVAEHFNKSDGDYMLWFEDDMLLVPEQSICRNGLQRHVDNWLRKCLEIVKTEKLDFLKISFSEFWGDHHKQWSWHNLSLEDKPKYFPTMNLKMQWNYSGVFSGLSYLIGEVYYSNWPCLMTKAGNRKVFLKPKYKNPPHEQDVMGDAYKLLKAGGLRSGVLMASLIDHNRVHYYDDTGRKEA